MALFSNIYYVLHGSSLKKKILSAPHIAAYFQLSDGKLSNRIVVYCIRTPPMCALICFRGDASWGFDFSVKLPFPKKFFFSVMVSVMGIVMERVMVSVIVLVMALIVCYKRVFCISRHIWEWKGLGLLRLFSTFYLIMWYSRVSVYLDIFRNGKV